MITRPISRSISRSIALAINDPNSAGFNPLSLFAAGEQGVWYDPSDLSTLFQDAAGTIPVTAAGQPVGMMRDKSGRGNHATQATATSRPILQTASGKWYLAFDGVDDGLATAAINFTATNKMTWCVGATKEADATFRCLVELTANVDISDGGYMVGAAVVQGDASRRTWAASTRGTSVTRAISAAVYPAPDTKVITTLGDNATTDSVLMRLNGTVPTTTPAGVTTPANYANAPIYIGRRGGVSNPFIGKVYGVIARGAASTSQQITDIETYINSKTGAY